ncbi:MAG: hypothetical protein ACREQZ_12260 [Woeseiaceae bacterium]
MYTDIADCPMVELDEETGAASTLCAGIAGYELLVTDEDARMSITVIAPDHSRHALDYWHVVTFAFSSLGTKAEWRVIDRNGALVPVALIVRVNASEGDDPSAITSYLAVAKITPETTCVTDRIDPSADMNAAARRAADTTDKRPCLPYPEE